MASGHPVVVIEQPGRTPLHVVLHEALEVGRDCGGLLLDDPGVSRRHLVLRPDGGRVVVVDLGSTNGTTVDGQRLDDRVTLTPDAVVRLGDTTIRLAARGAVVGLTGVASDRAPVTSIDRVAVQASVQRPDPPQAAVRDGTVTIVFTDIESSTPRAQSLGDERWMEVLTRHKRAVRERLAQYGGVEMFSEGDGFMLTFASARRALECMIAVQRDIARQRAESPGDGVRIRVGAHTGEAIVGDDGELFGLHIHVASRIAGQAAGDEILVSSLVREIVVTHGDLRFGPARPTELKGLAGTFVLHPLLWSDTTGGMIAGALRPTDEQP